MKNIFKKDQGKEVDGMRVDSHTIGKDVGDGSFSTPTKPIRKKVKSPSSNPLKKAFRNMKGRGGPNAHCRPPSTDTPPITPSPTRGEGNNLKVQILSSPSNDPMNIGPSIDTGSSADFDSERAVAEAETAYSCATEESSLFQTVLGMSCGERMFDMDMTTAAQRLGLSTIPEDKRIHEWGTAPGLSDGEGSDEFFLYDDRVGSAQDYYEMVLQEDDPVFCMPINNDKVDNTNNGVNTYGIGKDQTVNVILQEESFEDVFGVDDSVERGGREEESRYDGNRNGKGILTKSVFGRSERSSSVNSSNSEDSGNDTKKKRMFKFTRKNSKKKSQSPVRRTETSTSLTTTTPKSPSRKNLAKILHLRVQRKKAKSENTVENKARSGQSPSIQKPKLPRWKCVHDSKTGRVYYYHTLTRQVTWERPKGFVEWKVATLSPSGNQSNGELKEKDKALEKKFFYNVITKETRWDMPENFVQWKEVWDGRSEKCYYYNVLTRATTWNRPEGVVMDRNGEATEENENVRDGTDGKTNVTAEDITENVTNITTGASEGRAPFVATTVSNKSQSTTQKQQEIMDNSRGRSAEKLVGTNSMKVSLAAEKATSINPATSTQESNVEREESEKKGAVKMDKVDESHAKLAKLLSDYCPDEKENNSQLLKLAKGQETPIIVAIETLVEDTPFDELRLAIFSYVKATVIEMGEEPYDEKRRSGPRSSKFGSRPPLTKYVSHLSTSRGMKRAETYDTSSAPSAAYSLGSRAMSHMTGNSGSTMPINNTSNRSGGDIRRAVNLDKMVSDVDDKHKHVNDSKNIDVDNSADDIDTGDKLQNNSKILLDMKIVGDEKKKGDVLHNREERLTNRVQSPVQTLKHKSTANVGINLEVQSSCSSSLHLPSVNAETIESAYAGDCDDETDLGAWEEEDDVSALSDCFSLEKRTRPIKQKKVNSKKQSSYRKDTTRSPISHSDNADDLGKESRPYITKKIALKSSSQSETIQYTSFNPNKEESENSGGSGSIGYEEIPRANATVDVKTASARGHREVYSLSSWDDDTVTTNESDK